jgi:plasmid stabilization system protein ParE
MKVVWTRAALVHLTNVYDYIARDSPRYAIRTVDRLTERSRQAGQFPQSGSVVPDMQTTPFVNSLRARTELFIASNHRESRSCRSFM